MKRRPRAAAVGIFATLTFLAALDPAVAHAQSKEQLARAEASFNAGKRLLTRGDDAEACARFAESKQLAPAVGVTLYLADCYQRLGQVARAWTEFRSAETLARAKNDKRAEVARGRADALEPRLGHLTVRVAGGRDTSLDVALDGGSLPPETWGTPLPVDPGEHVVTARLGLRHREFNVHVDADKRPAEVLVDSVDEPTAAATAPQPGPAETSAPSSDAPAALEPSSSGADSGRSWASLGLLAAGAVGVGVGSVYGIMAMSDRSASNNGPCNSADLCNARGLSLRGAAIDEARVSTVAFTAGVVALGASAVVWFAWPGKPQSAVAVSASPIAGGAAATLQTTF